jgi:hypothetical protein
MKYRILELPSGAYALEVLSGDLWVRIGEFRSLEGAEEGMGRAIAHRIWLYNAAGTPIT